ncbi:hypothetical protein OSCT_0276 [Oscillochloris trichoides DG-6]|uniref:FHA domain-containing protein n=1 Tax=Oscillochloris trichoides DG-6 TaxID=765420 RepID=E1IAC5_9CHLR|nr:hypothetical protein [Oscillochloris trichoides]EFO81879.1 hypothetical protein OSCT_0276 [Oscillochloris trichoides DG-6]
MPPTNITITLHWQSQHGTRAANIVCEDSPPQTLIPILRAGCGLPSADPQGATIPYLLRVGNPSGPHLQNERPLSQQGISDGSHLWIGALRASPSSPRHCGVVLGEGGALLLPPMGVALTRRWLLDALALFHPDAYAHEMRLFDAGRSDYRFVSKQPHCRISMIAGVWQIHTERDDVATLHNNVPLIPQQPRPLSDGDTLQLGDAGPQVGVMLL